MMPSTKLTCPHCGQHLKSATLLQAGDRVYCSGCGHCFAAPVDNATPLTESGKSVSFAAKTSVESLQAPRRPAAKQALGIGLVLGGFLLLLAPPVGLVAYFALHTQPAKAPDETTAAAPSDDAAAPVVPPREDILPPPPPPPTAQVPANAPAESELASWLPPENQEQVNKAVDRGVKWLKERQKPRGSWELGGIHDVGKAALPALTLLECGVPAEDERIRKALRYVRRTIPDLSQTYDLSLAILFLDRLGDPNDEKYIHTCALRLAAGQKASGGWTYTCPTFTKAQQEDLLFVLQQTQPRNGTDLFVGEANSPAPPGFIATEDSKFLPLGGSFGRNKPAASDTANSLDKEPPDPQAYTKALERLPVHLRKLPALLPPKKAHKKPDADRTDNSNTQFAILGLSAAKRHNLPLDRCLALIVQRFHTSQLPDGHWNYHYYKLPQEEATPAMTGAGLLGLAVGLGLAADHRDRQAKHQLHKAPAIEKGFDFLAKSIGKPLSSKQSQVRKRERISLYFLWTVERCGVLYKRRYIGGKDWYGWGVQLLLDHQSEDGSWTGGYYPGSGPIADTCFALLFFKRANLAKELTKKLEFFTKSKALQTGP